jgi:undecaprenyl-diphosphatase
LISLDRRVEAWIVAHRLGSLDWLSIGLSRIGTLGAVWVVLALVLAVKRRRPGLLAAVIAADIVADLISELGKAIVPRHRPFVHQLGPAMTTHSFPSGHAATSFACAAVLASFAPRLRLPLYALAVLIALSRLYNGDHFPLDVIAGGLLGLATALLLLAAIRRGRRRGRRPG